MYLLLRYVFIVFRFCADQGVRLNQVFLKFRMQSYKIDMTSNKVLIVKVFEMSKGSCFHTGEAGFKNDLHGPKDSFFQENGLYFLFVLS